MSPPPRSTSSFPISVVKITRNSKGNANVKNAEAGFRQKALFVKRIWRRT